VHGALCIVLWMRRVRFETMLSASPLCSLCTTCTQYLGLYACGATLDSICTLLQLQVKDICSVAAIGYDSGEEHSGGHTRPELRCRVGPLRWQRNPPVIKVRSTAICNKTTVRAMQSFISTVFLSIAALFVASRS
jgi:hypothetical protein